MGLVGGVVALNLVFLAVGYCALAAALRGSSLPAWLSYAGVALLAGAALVGTGVFYAVIAGFTAGLGTLAVVSVLVAAAGLGASLLPGLRTVLRAPEPEPRRPASPVERTVTIVASAAVIVIAAFALVGGFRASPWLDDVWGIWLPKGVALAAHGLDPRLFAPSGTYVSFEVPDYPLWWSIVLALDVRLVGEIDLRAADGQLAILALAFLGAAARLLYGAVRAWVLAAALLLLVASPEFLRHVHGGLADLPLAIFLSLAALLLAGWILRRSYLYLGLAVVFAAAAAQIKSEGLPQALLLFGVAAVVAALAARQALVGVLAGGAVAFLSALPWIAWRSAHDVPSSVGLRDALDPGYLAERSDRVGPALGAVTGHLADPTEWLLLVPLLLVLTAIALLVTRRPLVLAPLLLVLAGFAFWIWAYWAETEELDYLLDTSSYRVVDTLVLTAWVFLPLLAEVILRGNEEGGARR
jgi:hypothetical protein